MDIKGITMKYFAISKTNYSFIVSADSLDALNDSLNNIHEKYQPFYKKYIRPGYYIIQASSIKEAKNLIKNQESQNEYDTAIYGPLLRITGTT